MGQIRDFYLVKLKPNKWDKNINFGQCTKGNLPSFLSNQINTVARVNLHHFVKITPDFCSKYIAANMTLLLVRQSIEK